MNVLYVPGASPSGYICYLDPEFPLIIYYSHIFNGIMNLLHPIINLILVLLLIVGIIKTNKIRRHLTNQAENKFLSKLIYSSLTL